MRTERLQNACNYLSTHLINLKTILLFLTLSNEEAGLFLSELNADWVQAVRSLPPKDKFEVRYGTNSDLTRSQRAAELGQGHKNTEQSLQLLLTPELLFKQKHTVEVGTDFVQDIIGNLACDVEVGLGWMTFEKDGKQQHETGTFLLVEDSKSSGVLAVI